MSFPYLSYCSLLGVLCFLQSVKGEQVSISTTKTLSSHPLDLDDASSPTVEGIFNESSVNLTRVEGLDSLEELVVVGNMSGKDEGGNNVTVEDSLEDLGGMLVDSRLGLEELEGLFHALENQTEGPETSNNSTMKLLEGYKDILDISGNVTDESVSSDLNFNDTVASGIFSNSSDLVDVSRNSTEEEETPTTTSSVLLIN